MYFDVAESTLANIDFRTTALESATGVDLAPLQADVAALKTAVASVQTTLVTVNAALAALDARLDAIAAGAVG